MADNSIKEFLDLNLFRGVGENPVYHPPTVNSHPRFWSLDQWSNAPRELGYVEFPYRHWRGVRLLKDPETQSAYHNMLWELRPKTIVELGVYSGGSVLLFRDLTRIMGIESRIIGIDKNLKQCQIPDNEMAGIELHEANSQDLDSLNVLLSVEHPLILIDDAHSNTFNILKWSVKNILVKGDYFIIEDMIPFWHRYSPNMLCEYIKAFSGVLEMDMMYSNSCQQLDRGVFRRV